LNALKARTEEQSKLIFKTETDFAKSASSYSLYENQVKSDLNEEIQKFEQMNSGRVLILAKAALDECIHLFKMEIKDVILPAETHALDEVITRANATAVKKYYTTMGLFDDTIEYRTSLKRLVSDLDEQITVQRNNNVLQMKMASKEAFDRVTLRLAKDVENYYFSYFWIRHARSVAKEEIGKSIQSPDLVTKVIEEYLLNDMKELNSIVQFRTYIVAALFSVVFILVLYLASITRRAPAPRSRKAKYE